MNKQKRTWFPVFLVIGGLTLMLAAGVFPRRAEAEVTIECEILVEGGATLMPGQPSAPIVGINFEEGGEGEDGEDPVVAWPGEGDPLIVYIDPISGADGVVVTIYGYNFTGVTSVTLTADGVSVVVPPDEPPTINVDPDTGVPTGYDEVVFTTPPPPDPTGGATDVTVTTTTGASDTLPGGFFYVLPSPYPSLPGSSTVRWVEVIISTNILDHFRSNSSGAALIDDFRGYLNSVFQSLTIWVDGYSELEDDNGVFFLPDDRRLTPLLDLNVDGSIDGIENQSAEVYENPLPGSRGRVFSFARNAALGATLRAAGASDVYETPLTSMDMLIPRREASNNEFMDQIVYRFACAWPSHRTPPTGGRGGFVEIGPLFDIPGLGWPPSDPGGFSGTVPSHVSNQYIGGPGEDEDNPWAVLFEGNDYYVTIEPGCGFRADAILNVRVTAEVPAIPVPPPGFPAHPVGIQTDPPPPDPFEGCETEDSIGAEGLNFILEVDPVPYRASAQALSTPHVETRPRPDTVGTALERWHWNYETLPRIIQMEYPTAVIAIHAHGGDPSELATSVFIDRLTITLTDIGGGAQFGRDPDNTFPGDGDFNPWFGLDDMARPIGFRGVDVYRDSDNDGDLDPESDLVYWTWPVVLPNITTGWEPYFYIQDPGKGVDPYYRDDPEWTIVLDLAAPRGLSYSPYEYVRDVEAMTEDNYQDFALEEVPEDDPAEAARPDFFVAIRLDSGYADGWDVRVGGDGTGIEYGADFRAYIKPELITNLNDPLHQLAQSAAGTNFPSGVVLSTGPCELMELAMDEIESPPYQGVMQTHDYVRNMKTTNRFNPVWWWEAASFFMAADERVFGGPRSPFFPIPPTFSGPGEDPPLSDVDTWYVPSLYYTALTLYEEWNLFEDNIGHRTMAQRIDNLSPPTAMLGMNFVNSPDPSTILENELKVAQITCYVVSEDRYGPTGFEPSDLLPIADDGLGDTGISLWADSLDDEAAAADDADDIEETGGSPGWFDVIDDTQVPLMLAEIGEAPEPIEMDGIPQDRNDDGEPDPDLWGYRVVLEPVDAFNVPIDDDIGPNQGDDLYIVIQTSDTLSYKDKIEVVIPHGGVVFNPTGRSAAGGTKRYHREFFAWDLWYDPPQPRLMWKGYLYGPDLEPILRVGWWPLPIEWGDFWHSAVDPAPVAALWYPDLRLADEDRLFGTSQVLANVATELSALTRTTFDTDADGVTDAYSIGPGNTYEVIAIDVATLNEDSKVYLEYLVVEFYNQGEDADGDGRPDDDDFSPSIDLLPFTTDSATSGIGLYRDNPNNKDGEFSSDDIPIQFDDPPDLIGVSGEPPIQVRMTFSSPGTDNWAGTVLPVDEPSPISLVDETADWEAYPDGAFGRQLVPTTFGRNEDGAFIGGDEDARADFFVVIRTSDTLGLGDDFSVGIVSWGPDTPTGVDADTFTAPYAPWQPSDEYEIFNENPWATRGIGFIETPMEIGDPVPASFTIEGGFDFLRTRSTAWVETVVLYATSGVIPTDDDDPTPTPTPTPGPGAAAPMLGGGGGGGGCLIATAAFGTRYEEHVVTLTTFRDRYLLTNAGGAWLVKRYYSLSPRLAEFVARHEVVRAVVRQIMRPVAAVARLCIETSSAGKIAILFGAALLVAALIQTRRKWHSVRVRV